MVNSSSSSCCLFKGSVLMNYSTLLDSIKKSAQTEEAELINSELKGVRCVQVSFATQLLLEVLKKEENLTRCVDLITLVSGLFGENILDALETL